MDRAVILGLVLGLHLAAAVLHGIAHGLVPVELAWWQNGLVIVSVFVGPITGVALDRRDRPLGLPVFTVSMAGALAIGAVLHFLVENPDNVSAIPAGQWRFLFQVTAVGVFVTPLVGTAVGLRYWIQSSDTSILE